MHREKTVPKEFFEELYSEKSDPWGMLTEWYEQRKYAVTIASLPKERYRSCFEPGCAVGALTRRLAPRCDRLVAVDCAAAAVESTLHAVEGFDHVQVEQSLLPTDMPSGTYDLIVLSEILYYFSLDDLQTMLDGALARLEPGGDIIAVHHRKTKCTGVIHATLKSRPELVGLISHQDENFVLDVLRRSP